MSIDFSPRLGAVVPRSGDLVSRLYATGGLPYGERRLALLEKYLARRGVTLVLDPNAIGGSFSTLENGTAILRLPVNLPAEIVWHELGHFILWRRFGTEAYRRLPRVYGNNVPEQFVFDLLQCPDRWDRLTPEYRLRMVDYIENFWGGMGR